MQDMTMLWNAVLTLKRFDTLEAKLDRWMEKH